MNARAASLIREHLPADKPVHRSGDEGKIDPKDIIRAFDGLPEFVRYAKFGQVNERILDSKMFEMIVSQRPVRAAEADWAGRLRRRHEALHPHIGKKLACAFVRLPGVHYTIEVDVEACEVVYWEWQAD